MKIIFSFFIIILFLGCSDKINLDNYRPAFVPKNKAAPKNLKPKIEKITLVKFPFQNFYNINVSKIAFYNLQTFLSSSKLIELIRVINSDQIKNAIKAAEISKETNSSLGADFLIKGSVLNVTYIPTYHKGFYYYVKIKHKKIRKYSPPYYSYKACTDLHIDVLSLPELHNKTSQNFQGCSYFTDNNSYEKFYPDLITQSAHSSAKEAFNFLKKFFAPKGYIYEVMKNGDDLIAKISLGKNQGIYQNLKLNIYTLKKDPYTGDTEKYLIGTGKVSNIIFNNSSWITIDLNKNQKLQIGDMVIPNFNFSFWDLF